MPMFVQAGNLAVSGGVFTDIQGDRVTRYYGAAPLSDNHTAVEGEQGTYNNAHGGHYDAELRAASRAGDEDTVKLLLQRGADVNAQGDEHGGTPLIAASRYNRAAVVELLLDNGADINAQTAHEGTALIAASGGGHEAVVRLLLEHGADINLQTGRYNTALTVASDGGHEAVRRLLLEYGAVTFLDG